MQGWAAGDVAELSADPALTLALLGAGELLLLLGLRE